MEVEKVAKALWALEAAHDATWFNEKNKDFYRNQALRFIAHYNKG